MKDCIEIIKRIQEDWNYSEFFPPASETAVSEFEKKNNIMIPDSYKEFLYLSNGAHLFGGDIYLYNVNLDEKFRINYDFSEGNVPKELLILGYYRSSHICYDSRYNSFILYDYEEYDDIKEECIVFSDFHEMLNYFIDIAIN